METSREATFRFSSTPCISYGWVCAYLENPADFPQAVDRLELSVMAHATTHTHKRCAQAKKNMNEEFNPNSIENKRELDKIGLELFVHNLKENSFNDAVNELIQNLKSDLNKEITEFLEFQEQEKNSQQNYHLDTYYLEEKLLALSEMNVVYAYKDFEINIKRLVGAAYGVQTKEFYKWETIMDFLKSKNIRYSELSAYQEVNDLRKVNNSIKHSTKNIDIKIKSISEFSKLEHMRHYELSAFFNRIKDCPVKYLDALSTEIYKNLYEFDDNRLENIAELYSLRMDKEIADRFIKHLKKKY